MKAIHYCTASIYTADYRSYGYLAPDDRPWRMTSSTAEQLVQRASPSQQWPADGLGCVDPRLGEVVRLAVLLEQSADGRQWFVAATVAGLKSSHRADFTGRRIRDGLHVTACGPLSDQASLQEAIQAVRAIWRLAHDPSLSLDHWCCPQAFEQDLIPFPPADALWRHLVEAGLQPLEQPDGSSQVAVEPRSRPSQTHQSQVHWSEAYHSEAHHSEPYHSVAHCSEAHRSQARQGGASPPRPVGAEGACSIFSFVDRLLSELSDLPEKVQRHSGRGFDVLANTARLTSSRLRKLRAHWQSTHLGAHAPCSGSLHSEAQRDCEDPSDPIRLERLLRQLQQGRLPSQRVLLRL